MKEKRSGAAKGSAAGRENHDSWSISALQVLFVHLICGLGLALALWVAQNVYSVTLVSDPSLSLRVLWVIDGSIGILLYSCFRLDPEQCSYLKAVGQGVLALPIGALLNALGAIALGAPVGIQYLPKTIDWSLLMSSLTFGPAASVLGASWTHWQRIFAHTAPNEAVEYMICIPAHGAVIGAWFGAWPMPLDWERPWQEWPICVTYGALAGYLLGMVISLGFVVVRGGRQRLKGD